MLFTIDRFEGNFAIVENSEEEIVMMPRVLVPAEAKEGDVLRIEIDEKETEKRKSTVEELVNDVFK